MTEPPSLTDLEQERAELAHQLELQAAYIGNNPNKHRTAVRESQERVNALALP